MFLKALEGYFFFNLDYYFPGCDFQINLFILALALGMCIAAILITIYKRNLSYIIRQLIRHKAVSEESSKTLDELKIKPTFFVKSSLKNRGQLSAIVAMVGGFAFEKNNDGKREEKIDFSTASFYIKNPDRAARINEQKYPSYVITSIACVCVLFIAVIITVLMPDILYFATGIAPKAY